MSAYKCERCGEYRSGSGTNARYGEYTGNSGFTATYEFDVQMKLCDECKDGLDSVIESYLEVDADE